MQWQIQGRGPPLFFDQNEARRAEKSFFGDRTPPSLYLKVWIRHCHVPRCQSPSLQNSITDADHDCRSPIKYFVEHNIPGCQGGIKSNISLKPNQNFFFFTEQQLFAVGWNWSRCIVLAYATSTFPIMHLLCPPKFCISSVFNFSWDGCKTQEK